jgi:regulator of sirC expression with transglutaminase-like and TPR domain
MASSEPIHSADSAGGDPSSATDRLSEVEALVRLLDDPDATVQEAVQERLQALGRDALPYLQTIRTQADASLHDAIDNITYRLHRQSVLGAWASVMDESPVDLERGAFLLAFYRFPYLDVSHYRETLDDWAERVRPDVDTASGAERAHVLARFMHRQLGFSGNQEHYYDPNNSYLNRVIERRTGIPISLSVLYLLLGQRLGLSVYGVNMPAHFLVKYKAAEGEVFIDLFNDGTIVTQDECIQFLLRAGIRPSASHFASADPTAILLRMVRNLLHLARESGQDELAHDLAQLIAPWDPDLDADDLDAGALRS